ncbi:hypothetical protein AtNW77_Chr1g0015961 [Arabidopsis thaliana]
MICLQKTPRISLFWYPEELVPQLPSTANTMVFLVLLLRKRLNWIV